MYAPGRLGSVKLGFLVNTSCTHNLLLKVTFDHLPAAVKEKKGPQDAATKLADGSGLPIYRRIELMERIKNFPFATEFLFSCVSDEEILGMAFLTSQKCALYFERDVLALREMPFS